MSPPGASAQWLDGVGVLMLASWRMVPRSNTRTLWSLLHTYSRSWSARAREVAGQTLAHSGQQARKGIADRQETVCCGCLSSFPSRSNSRSRHFSVPRGILRPTASTVAGKKKTGGKCGSRRTVGRPADVERVVDAGAQAATLHQRAVHAPHIQLHAPASTATSHKNTLHRDASHSPSPSCGPSRRGLVFVKHPSSLRGIASHGLPHTAAAPASTVMSL